jgi:predicted dehydrogenase
MSDDPISRRSFVNEAAAGGLAFTIVPGHVLSRAGRTAPSDKLNVACIGVGGQGESDVRGMAANENIYALCDVDWVRATNSFNANPKAKKFKDYREMLDKEAKNIDCVTITTPDHVHAVATMAALKAGKHVYCQKPLTRTIGEARSVAQEAARRPKQATQMGNQGHSQEGTRQIREWVEAGAIGTVRTVELWTNRPIWPQGMVRPTEMHHVPSTLDWELWLGPAASRPYHPSYAPFNWRGYWDFGTGALGDMACHIMDACFWTLGLRYPTRITAETSQQFIETAPRASRITYEFPASGGRPAVTVVWRDGNLVPPRPHDWNTERPWPFDTSGQLWIGDSGTLVAGTYGENPRLSDDKKHADLMAKPPAIKYPRTKGVHVEWTDAIRAGTQPGSNFPGHAAPLTEMVLLGNLALKLGRVELNPATGDITGQSVPDELIKPLYREGWKL